VKGVLRVGQCYQGGEGVESGEGREISEEEQKVSDLQVSWKRGNTRSFLQTQEGKPVIPLGIWVKRRKSVKLVLKESIFQSGGRGCCISETGGLLMGRGGENKKEERI